MARPRRRVSDKAHDQPPPSSPSPSPRPPPSPQRPPRRPRQPTLAFDRACYTAEQAIAFTGSGYTPSGPVKLLFSVARRGASLLHGRPPTRRAVSPGGSASQRTRCSPTDEDRRDLAVTATDQTRADAGAPPESQFGIAQFTFTRWAGFSPGRYVPGRKVEVEAYGWAFAAGKPLYFLFQHRAARPSPRSAPAS